MKPMLKKLITAICFFWASATFAATQSAPISIGEAAQNLLLPVGAFASIIYSMCYVLGAAFIMGSMIRFKEHRQNPSQTPISRPIAIFIFGLVFIVIPIIAKLSSSSI